MLNDYIYLKYYNNFSHENKILHDIRCIEDNAMALVQNAKNNQIKNKTKDNTQKKKIPKKFPKKKMIIKFYCIRRYSRNFLL